MLTFFSKFFKNLCRHDRIMDPGPRGQLITAFWIRNTGSIFSFFLSKRTPGGKEEAATAGGAAAPQEDTKNPPGTGAREAGGGTTDLARCQQ